MSLRPSQFTRLSFDYLHWLRFFSEVVERWPTCQGQQRLQRCYRIQGGKFIVLVFLQPAWSWQRFECHITVWLQSSYFQFALDFRDQRWSKCTQTEFMHVCVQSIASLHITALRNNRFKCVRVINHSRGWWTMCGLWSWQGRIISVSVVLWVRGVWHLNLSCQERQLCVCVCLCVVAAGVRVWRKWGQVAGVCENVKNAISAYTLSLWKGDCPPLCGSVWLSVCLSVFQISCSGSGCCRLEDTSCLISLGWKRCPQRTATSSWHLQVNQTHTHSCWFLYVWESWLTAHSLLSYHKHRTMSAVNPQRGAAAHHHLHFNLLFMWEKRVIPVFETLEQFSVLSQRICVFFVLFGPLWCPGNVLRKQFWQKQSHGPKNWNN